MFIPYQTYEGICINVSSVKFLLKSGAEFVLTERFGQDVLEEYFGRQRCISGFNTTPSVFQFGYNANALHVQRFITPTRTGNTKGVHRGKRMPSWTVVDSRPLKKRRTNQIGANGEDANEE
eukprot:TCONS_00038357-protein